MQQNIQLKILTSLWLLMAFLFCICVCGNTYAQINTVKGKVVNESGTPVPGVTVAIKGTNIGTTTNDNGDFIIESANKDASLIISSIGYERQELSLDGKTNITITLKQKASELDQAIVIAYGTTTKRLNTGDVSKVTAEEIERQPVSNPLAALEGRVPGLVVIQNTGVPGGSFFVQIRGQESIAAGNLPLYIVDGVPFTSTSITSSSLNGSIINGGSPLNSINPSDIQSIEILKDADATAIYGSRGSNGAILITTKRGKPGKLKFNLNIYTGGGKVARTMGLLDTKNYLIMRREAFKNDGVTPTIDNAYDLLLWDTTRYTNWQKELIGGTAGITDVQSSLSGGNEKTIFYLSGGYHEESTVFPGDFADRKGSLAINLNHHSLNNKIRFTFTGTYVTDNNNLPVNDLASITLPPPDAPAPFDKNGNLYWTNGFSNPYGLLLQKFKAATNNILGHLEADYLVFPGLQFKVSIGGTQMWAKELSTNPKNATNPAYDPVSTSSFGNSSLSTWIVEPQVEYGHSLFGGTMSLLAGATLQENIIDRTIINASGFYNDNLLDYPGAASSITINNFFSGYSQYRYEATFGRMNYNLSNKYIINLSGRRDGSSRFGPNKQFANFASVGAAWIFTNEKWINLKPSFLSFGKIRASYGTTGNDQIGDYQYLDSWRPTNYPYQGTSGLAPARLFNPNYSWEINRKLEAAVELGFMKDRFLLSVNYFRNRSSSQLVGYPLPGITGFMSIQGNLPALVQNKGMELEFTSYNIKNHTFEWSSHFNISFPANKLLAYPGLASSSYANTYVIGKPLSISPSLHFIGINTQTGVMQFEDVDHNGSDLDIPGDFLALKKVAQEYYGGLQNSFSFKGWQLDIFFQFVKQTGFNYIQNFLPPGLPFNQPVYVMSRWQKPGDKTAIQLFTQGGNIDAFLAYLYATGYGDDRISDASFIRLKNLSLSYSLPGKITERWHLSQAKIYVRGQNLLTLTDYMGMDPENNGSNLLPPLKVLTAGIQFTF